jgi:hypothetical protein
MKKLSGQIKTFANSVIARAEAREGMMAAVAVAVLAMSLAEFLSRRKRSGPDATSIGCDPEAAFRRRLDPLQYSIARSRANRDNTNSNRLN